jgi:SNF2 family DNA or RNA helicase
MLVIAPNMLHRQWVDDELPKFWPSDCPITYAVYDSSRAGTKEHDRAIGDLGRAIGRTVLAMTYDALLTERGYKLAEQYLRKSPALLVADESARIKNPKAKRTKTLLKLEKLAEYRRILTGTPITNSPLDLYSQIQFLDPSYWASNGYASYWAFRAHFSVLKTISMGPNRSFQKIVGYQNLEELTRLVGPITHRVTKDQVLDLPEKLYTVRSFDMSEKQRELYDKLRKEFLIELGEHLITAPLALVRLLRLQQITSGYLGHEGKIFAMDSHPRIELLKELTEDMGEQCIIWARFTESVDQIMKALGDRAVRYDGESSLDERSGAIEAFRGSKAQFFVSKPSCGGEGLNLTCAKAMIYYENDFDLAHRLQSEARAHRIGQTSSLQVIDIVARNTIDEKIAKALKDKQVLAELVMKDKLRELLQ